MAGLAALFTRDFFALAKDRLNDDGVFVQWIHSYQMDWPTFALVGRTFADVFPNSILMRTRLRDYLMVGFKGKDGLKLANARGNLRFAQQSKNVTLLNAKVLYRLLVTEDLSGLCGQGPINTDNWPWLEFAAPKFMYMDDPVIDARIREGREFRPETKKIVWEVTTDVDLQIDFAALAFSVDYLFADMIAFSQATAAQRERFFKLVETYCANNPVDYSIFKDDELKRRCRSIQIEAIQNRISLMPDKAASYSYLALLYYGMGILDEAIANYLKSLQVEPYDAEAHYNLGLALTGQGRLDEAVTHYTKSLRIKPDFADAHSNLAYALARRGRFDEAITHFMEVLRIKPDDAEAHSNLGMVLTKQGKFNEAIRHFTEALRIKPNFADAHSNLGYALARQGKLNEAITHYTEALWINPNLADVHNNLGVALARQGKFDEAITHFTEALRIKPGFSDARRNLRHTLALQGKYDELPTDLPEAIQLDPNSSN
jgi:Flp pilus assembly protein TadD